MNANRARGSGKFFDSKMPLHWLKISLNSVEKIGTILENTPGKLIGKSSSPFTNSRNLVVKDGCRLDLIVKVSVDAIC